MENRRGIGATAASAVVFSTILISCFFLASSSYDRERLYAQSGSEDLLYDQSMALAAASSVNVLLSAQSAIKSTVITCDSAEAMVGGLMGGISSTQSVGNVTVSVSAALAKAASSPGDSYLGPLYGYEEGDLNLLLSVDASGSSGSGVEFKTNFSVPAHLPARLPEGTSDCLGASRAIENALTVSIPRDCNITAVGTLLWGATRQAAEASARDGFAFGFSYHVANQDPCRVHFTVSLEQDGINGPGGIFSLRLRESG